MKKITILTALLCALCTFGGIQTAIAQTAPQKITGTLDIDYQTRVKKDMSGAPRLGVEDIYKLNLNVTDGLIFAGTIKSKPTIVGGMMRGEQQAATVDYDITLSVRNPANPAQTMAVGKFVGTVPVDRQGVYQYDAGNLRIAVDAKGRAAEFTSAFKGLAEGKAPEGAATLRDSLTKQALTVTQRVKGGQMQKIVVTKYDLMNFNGLQMAAGPVKAYPETRINGKMAYDYQRSAWYFKTDDSAPVVLAYTGREGKDESDTLSGNIRWVEDPQRAVNGKGQYEFDLRVDEPTDIKATTEAAVFAPSDDESAFFATDTGINGLTGTMKYKDTMSGETVTASHVEFDLTGNGLDKVQVTALAKLIGLVCVVPMNAE